MLFFRLFSLSLSWFYFILFIKHIQQNPVLQVKNDDGRIQRFNILQRDSFYVVYNFNVACSRSSSEHRQRRVKWVWWRGRAACISSTVVVVVVYAMVALFFTWKHIPLVHTMMAIEPLVCLNCCNSPFGDGLETLFPFLFRELQSHCTVHILSVVFLMYVLLQHTQTQTQTHAHAI